MGRPTAHTAPPCSIRCATRQATSHQSSTIEQPELCCVRVNPLDVNFFKFDTHLTRLPCAACFPSCEAWSPSPRPLSKEAARTAVKPRIPVQEYLTQDYYLRFCKSRASH